MPVFKLPDLGEGLQEAEIRSWHVAVGDSVSIDQPLLAVETAKAVVDVPSPRAGTVTRLYGAPGDFIAVGAPLIEFAGSADADDTVHARSSAPPGAGAAAIRDTGVVVGDMQQGDTVVAERATTVGPSGGLKAAPAVRALAHRLGVDLSIVTPSGPDGTITAADVQRVHKILSEVGPLEKLRGARRAMALSMSQSRDEIMPATVCDDAVLHAWQGAQDITLRLLRALVAGCRAEPGLNAWYDHVEIGRRLLEKIHVGIAVDTPEGLFVAVLQDIAQRSAASLRDGLEKMKTATLARTVPAEELRGYTITLSNIGRYGGRYATPVIVPPTVAIVAAGAVREAVVALAGQIVISRVLPLSLSFDHRCVTGGEAARFLSAMIADLQQPQ